MRRKDLIIIQIICIFSIFYNSLSGIEITLQKKWVKNDAVNGFVMKSEINYYDELVIMFFKSGIKIVSRDKYYNMAPLGQGPGDVYAWENFILNNDQFIEIESYDKIQVFKRKKDRYQYENTLWKEKDKGLQQVKSALLINNKFYFSGCVYKNDNPKTPENFWIQVFDRKGNFIRDLVPLKNRSKRYYLMGSYMVNKGDRIFFTAEHLPEITIISSKSDQIISKKRLKMPHYYIPIPEDCFALKLKKRLSLANIDKIFAEWRMNYSRIVNVKVCGDYLLVQIRTCRQNQKTFALLFYDMEKFELHNTFFTDHLLVASKNSTLYFLNQGNPRIDDEAGDMIILLYKVKF